MRCPYCSKEIEDEAIICRHCGSAVMDPSRLGTAEASQESAIIEHLESEDVEKLLKALEEEGAELRREKASLPPSDEAAQHLEQAFAWEAEDKCEKALEECDAALQLDPTLADAHNLRGAILEELGREQEAVLAYREALRLDPRFDAARENLQAVENELQAGEIKRVAHREDEASRWEEAGWAEEQVIFEAESQTGYCPWQMARVELEPVSGAVTICGHPDGAPTITVPVSEIVSCEIVERDDVPRNLHRAVDGYQGGYDWGNVVLLLLLMTFDHLLARGTLAPTLKLTQSTSGGSSQGWVIHLRSKKRGRRGKVETLEMAGRVVAFLRQTGYRGTTPEELGGPSEDPGVSVREPSLPADLEGSVKEAGAQAGLETAPQPLDWRFWLDFVGAGLLGGLTAGGLGGFAAGFLPMLGLSGVLGGAVGGFAAGGIHWLGLRRYASVTWRWVFVCGVVGAVTWALASGWAGADLGSLDPVAFERDGVWAFVTVGIMAGILGGAVSGIAQAQILRQRILGVARWWIVVNTVGWAVGGAIFLPTFFAFAIGLIGGGNPGAAAAADIRTNEAICRPVCLPLLVVVPIWALVQAVRRR